MGAARSKANMGNVKDFVDSFIANNKVAMFSKSYCPYCHKAKDAINSFKIKPGTYEVVELDKRDDCQDVQDYLQQLTGARSVPRVFIGGKFIGGGDETAQAKSNGSLEKKLQEVGAI
jgi:glutaredoxin 3